MWITAVLQTRRRALVTSCATAVMLVLASVGVAKNGPGVSDHGKGRTTTPVSTTTVTTTTVPTTTDTTTTTTTPTTTTPTTTTPTTTTPTTTTPTTTTPTPAGSGSTATCSPSPCTVGTLVKHTITAPDSDGPDAKMASYSYQVERPSGLTNSPSNLVPLIVAYAGPGVGAADGVFQALAASQRFIIAYVGATHLIGTVDQYALPTVSPTPAAQAPLTCGVSGTNTCDDIPSIAAMLRQIVCSGAAPCENVDPNKVYVEGASKGGLAAMDTICDTRTSGHLHGGWITSNDPISPDTSGSQSSPQNCPAILGSAQPWSGGYWGGAPGLAPNTNISLGFEGGDADGTLCAGNAAQPRTCLNTGGVDAKGRWWFSVWQAAGDANPVPAATVAGSNAMYGRRIGCSVSPLTDVTYGSGLLHKKVFVGCTNPGRATEALMVHTGGHAWDGLDGIGGLNSPDEMWSFFTAYGG